MQQTEKKKETKERVEQPNVCTPPSETIANAHASGDGALERDKDTIIATEEEEGKSPSSNEAY